MGGEERKVSLTLHRGEIHCLAGENGSGKSTLIKVIAGVVKPDAGTIAIDGVRRPALHPIDAIHAGIQVIYQDFSLFPNLTVAENLALNTELDERRHLVRWREVRAIAERALAQIGVDMDLDRPVERLPVADKQLVAIARALLRDVRLVVLDEPTTALTRREVARLSEIIQRMQASGISALFVSHKLREVLEISERVTILRNGQVVKKGDVAEFDERKIAFHMTGRELSAERFAFDRTGKERVLEVKGLGHRDDFRDVSFALHRGGSWGSPGCSARAGPSWPCRSSASGRTTAAPSRSMASRDASTPCSARFAPASPTFRRTGARRASSSPRASPAT